jgi:hypothetical protein
MSRESIVTAFGRLRSYVEERRFAGHDPYDALNSPLVRAATLGLKWPRIAATQALRRCPVNIRPLIGIRAGHNPKALGLFLWGYSRLYSANPTDSCLETMRFLLERLEESRSPGVTGNGWGYNFDWQSRAFFIPRGTPTAVNSAFIGHALLDAWEATKRDEFLALALPIAGFLSTDLARLPTPAGFCFSYTPIDQYAVHNANLLAASFLARSHRHTGQEVHVRLALSALDYSMSCQKEDGSWHYSESPGAHFIDSFHTGFNLQAIRFILAEGLGEGCRAGYERGVAYYRDRFFLPDGTPKYFHHRVYPIDIHAPAQAVAFFSSMGTDQALVSRIVEWMVANMQAVDGHFHFRKERLWTNTIPYMRWAQAWAFHALAEYLHGPRPADR